MNRHAKSVDVMMSWAGIKITCLVSWLTMIKIVSKLENDGSFLMKSIEMEFCYGTLNTNNFFIFFSFIFSDFTFFFFILFPWRDDEEGT